MRHGQIVLEDLPSRHLLLHIFRRNLLQTCELIPGNKGVPDMQLRELCFRSWFSDICSEMDGSTGHVNPFPVALANLET